DDAYIQRATYLIWVGHNLERIGDRATNIAERVIFMCTGEYIEIMTDLEGPPFITQAASPATEEKT
ncbi:MAG TPA: phosphate transport system regulatory protein PhoU, partial [Anaerolineae bacterium]|nr:phosphate transport system regulatory protein PhoU [Anaerolineae bacterium]